MSFVASTGTTSLYAGQAGGKSKKSLTKKEKRSLLRHTKKVHAAYKKFNKLASKLSKKLK
jgi:hypothetical protein